MWNFKPELKNDIYLYVYWYDYNNYLKILLEIVFTGAVSINNYFNFPEKLCPVSNIILKNHASCSLIFLFAVRKYEAVLEISNNAKIYLSNMYINFWHYKT